MASAGQRDGLTSSQAQFLTDFAGNLPRGRAVLLRDGEDGIVRHWPKRARADNKDKPDLLSEVVARIATGRDHDRHTSRIIYYAAASGQAAAFPVYPAHQAKLLPKDWFKNKIILIGSTLPNIDEHQTPMVTTIGVEAGTKYGVVVHAHMINQIINNDSVISRPILVSPLLAALMAIAAGLLISIKTCALGIRLALTIGIMALSGLLCLAAFLAARIELAAAWIMLSGLLSAAAFSTRRWYLDYAERRFVQDAFSRYVSPDVVAGLVEDPKRLRLGGETREITYIFTDLAGFTTMSEQLPPEKVSVVLNAYLDGVCNLFIEHGATIDKIIGDAVVGLFGAPQHQPDQAELAVRLALAIDDYSESFRKGSLAKDISLGITRIGLHKGPAVIGNFGGSRFFDYTGIGDTVNTAARLEGANKFFGTRVCVSETVASANPETDFRPIGNVWLKGRSSSLLCFEPVASSHPGHPGLSSYKRAYELLEAGDTAAEEAFEALYKALPDDSLIQFQLQRLRNGASGTKILLDEK